MLQRIQSVYLGLSAVILIAFFFVPISSITVGDNLYVVKASGIYYQDNGNQIFETPLFALSAVLFFAAIMSIATIFQFKNRKMQIKLASLNLLLVVIALGLAFLRASDLPKDLASDGELVVNYAYTGFVLIVPLILLFLARMAIIKDDNLVKSLDRLR